MTLKIGATIYRLQPGSYRKVQTGASNRLQPGLLGVRERPKIGYGEEVYSYRMEFVTY